MPIIQPWTQLVSAVLVISTLFGTNAFAVSTSPSIADPNTTELASVVGPSSNSSADQLQLNGRINSVTPDTAYHQVDDLTRQIILKEIELERFNLHYKAEVGKQGRWKGTRYAAFQEANFGLNLAGGIAGAAERSTHFHRPAHVSVAFMENANIVSMIGSWIGATGAALELGITEFHDLQASHKGFSSTVARNHVLDLKAQINQLLTERDQLISIEQSAPILRPHAQIDLLEGKILRDIRDLGLLEYARFHINARRFVAFQQSLYFLDFAKYTTSAIGSIFAALSLHKHHRVWNGRAGVLFAVSGGLIMTTPILSRAIGIGVGKIQQHLVSPVSKEVETRELSVLETDAAALDQLCKNGQCDADSVKSPLSREVVYNMHDKSFQDQLHATLRETRAGKLVATQNIASGLFVGATKVASSVLFMVPGFNYNTKSELSARVTNYDLGIASIVSIPGSTVALLDTLRLQVKGEITRHKLAKQGLLPSQLINSRLKQLDDMEKRLTSSAIPSTNSL